MREQSVARAESICQTLLQHLQACTVDASAHSIFENAVNYVAADGLISVLSNDRPMQPYSVRLCERLGERTRPKKNQPVRFTGDGLFTDDGRLLVSFEGASPTKLTIQRETDLPSAAHGCAAQIHEFLRELGDGQTEGLAPLVFMRSETDPANDYASFLYPRVYAFRAAVKARAAIEQAAERLAGCGAGLTPSSDDFLSGYLAVLYKCGLLSPTLLHSVCDAAAARTNDISAAILHRLGDGLAGETLLALLDAVYAGQDIHRQVEAVARIGGTSGADTLAGVYFALQDCHE